MTDGRMSGGGERTFLNRYKPQLDGKRVAAIVARLGAVLNRNGIAVDSEFLEQLAGSKTPLEDLELYIYQFPEAGLTAQQVVATVERFDKEEWSLGYATDTSRGRIVPTGLADPANGVYDPIDPETGLPRPGNAGLLPDYQPNAANEYLDRYTELTTGRPVPGSDRDVPDEPLSSEEAHKRLKEEGYDDPVYADVPPSVLEAIQAVVYLRAQGIVTEDVDYEELLALDSGEAVKKYVKRHYDIAPLAPGVTLEQLIDEESQYTELPETYQETAQYAARSAGQNQGKPVLGDAEEEDEDHPGYLGGLPPDFRVTAKGDWGPFRPDAQQGYVPVSQYYEQEPEYGPYANLNFFDDRLDPNVIIAYQTLLLDSGWLSEDDFLLEKGSPGQATVGALGEAMYAANFTTARSWIEAAEARAKNRASKLEEEKEKYPEPVPVYTPLTYMKPDSDTLKQYVKDTFRAKLGREPTVYEVRQLIGGLASDYRAEFDALEAKNRAEFEATQAAREATMEWDEEAGQYVPKEQPKEAIDPNNPGTIGGVGNDRARENAPSTVPPSGYFTVGGGTIQTTDPGASFQERFESIFANEMARNRYRETSRDAFNDVQASIMMINRAIGGG